MIAKLKGILDSILTDYVILDVGGVGYRVFCSTKTMAKLAGIGHPAALFIETQVREDHIHLFGFADADEQNAFNLLTTVQGVGARVALAILSVLSATDIHMAVMTADSKAFTRANGVGPKLATRIVSELKNKVGGLGSDTIMSLTPPAGTNGAVLEEGISALVNLGYGRSEAGMLVAGILRKTPDADLSTLIRLSLKEIGKNNG